MLPYQSPQKFVNQIIPRVRVFLTLMAIYHIWLTLGGGVDLSTKRMADKSPEEICAVFFKQRKKPNMPLLHHSNCGAELSSITKIEYLVSGIVNE
jgi:hypothetical protein